MRKLNVYMNDRKAGVLTELNPGKGYVFCYDDEYLASSLPSISATLPKRRRPYESENLFPFFFTNLPEGRSRDLLCRVYKLDEEDYFGMLSTMADRDCIGAVQLRKTKNDESDR